MFTEDMSVFFDSAELADAALLDGVEVVGVFEEEFAVSTSGIGMDNTAPTFLMPTSAVPGVVEGMALVVSGAQYRVAHSRPAEKGLMVLVLEKAA